MPHATFLSLSSSNTVTMTVFRVPTDIQDVFRQLREANTIQPVSECWSPKGNLKLHFPSTTKPHKVKIFGRLFLSWFILWSQIQHYFRPHPHFYL